MENFILPPLPHFGGVFGEIENFPKKHPPLNSYLFGIKSPAAGVLFDKK